MFSLLKNNIFRFKYYLDNNSIKRSMSQVISVAVANCLIFQPFFENIYFLLAGAIIHMLNILFFVFYHIMVCEGKVKFNHDIYALPSVGESLKFLDEYKILNSEKNLGICVSKNSIFTVCEIEKTECDFIIMLQTEKDSIELLEHGGSSPFEGKFVITYFKSKSFWKTIVDIRQDKLNRIL